MTCEDKSLLKGRFDTKDFLVKLETLKSLHKSNTFLLAWIFIKRLCLVFIICVHSSLKPVFNRLYRVWSFCRVLFWNNVFFFFLHSNINAINITPQEMINRMTTNRRYLVRIIHTHFVWRWTYEVMILRAQEVGNSKDAYTKHAIPI